MKVRVDPTKCQGHGVCMMLDEDLVGCDELGYAVVRGDGSISREKEEVAARAAMNCPERAITVDDEA